MGHGLGSCGAGGSWLLYLTSGVVVFLAFLCPPGGVSPSRPLQHGLPELLAHGGLSRGGSRTSYTAELETIRPDKSRVQNKHITTSAVSHQPEESQARLGSGGGEAGSALHR